MLDLMRCVAKAARAAWHRRRPSRRKSRARERRASKTLRREIRNPYRVRAWSRIWPHLSPRRALARRICRRAHRQARAMHRERPARAGHRRILRRTQFAPVLVDPKRVRAVMTASWLIQLGWRDVCWRPGRRRLRRMAHGDRRGKAAMIGAARRRQVARCLARQRRRGEHAVLDFATSIHFRGKHIPGAWWPCGRASAKRRRRSDRRAHLLTRRRRARPARGARSGGAMAQRRYPRARGRKRRGSRRAFRSSGLARRPRPTTTSGTNPTITRPTSRSTKAYLDWEVALVEQIKRDPTIKFRAF